MATKKSKKAADDAAAHNSTISSSLGEQLEKAAPFSTSEAAEIAEERREKAAKAGAEKSVSGTVCIAMNFPRDFRFDYEDKSGARRELLVHGNATELRGLEMGKLPEGGKYGFTFGVPREVWEAVAEKYRNMPMFRNGLIFAVSSASDAKKEAETRRELRHGFEPIDPYKARTTPDAAKD